MTELEPDFAKLTDLLKAELFVQLDGVGIGQRDPRVGTVQAGFSETFEQRYIEG